MTIEKKVYEQALCFLSVRDHSKKELMDKLTRKGHCPETVEMVLEQLEKSGLLDDERLAQSVYQRYVEDGIYGNSYIAYRMHAKGLVMPKRMTIEVEVNRALDLVKRKLLIHENQIKRNKLASFLVNRGYGSDVIRAVCETLGNRVLLDTKIKKNYNNERQS